MLYPQELYSYICIEFSLDVLNEIVFHFTITKPSRIATLSPLSANSFFIAAKSALIILTNSAFLVHCVLYLKSWLTKCLFKSSPGLIPNNPRAYSLYGFYCQCYVKRNSKINFLPSFSRSDCADCRRGLEIRLFLVAIFYMHKIHWWDLLRLT